MRSSGAKVIYPLEVPGADGLKYKDTVTGQHLACESSNMKNNLAPFFLTPLDYEFPSKIKQFIDNFEPYPAITSLSDLVQWNEEHAEKEMPERKLSVPESVAGSLSALSPALKHIQHKPSSKQR